MIETVTEGIKESSLVKYYLVYLLIMRGGVCFAKRLTQIMRETKCEINDDLVRKSNLLCFVNVRLISTNSYF